MKIPNLRTVASLKRYVESSKKKGQNWFSNLGLSLFGRQLSALHKQKSPLVNRITRVVDFLNVSIGCAVYHLTNELKSVPLCQNCGVKKNKFEFGKYSTYCSGSCASRCEKNQAKKVATNLVKFGCENPAQSSSVKEKIRKTNIRVWGGHPLADPSVQRKRRKTFRKKHGVDHQSQLPEVHARQRASSQKSKMLKRNGKVLFSGLQGYEPQAIKYLITEKNYSVEQIIAHPSKTFEWKDDSGKRHVFHPDLKIRGKKHIIEVKSEWTYSGIPGEKKKNEAKRRAVVNSGYRITFLIMHPRTSSEPDWKSWRPKGVV